eukprot:TRINITY_DN17187_c0_g1_i1.p1 TRINITY_DN17187_c0_g1~~TRINITY_DN17187_c0_g1_i1.p1  ORF type:complete len:240 (+),score=86.06 TRINITY_DN17187_c0_g1_i1:48-767(+)
MGGDHRLGLVQYFTINEGAYDKFFEASKVFFLEENKKHYKYMTFAYGDDKTSATSFVIFDSAEQLIGSSEVVSPFHKEVGEYAEAKGVEFFGTQADYEKVKDIPEGKVFTQVYIIKEGPGIIHTQPVDNTTVRICPYFKVADRAKAEALYPDLVAAVEDESDLIHYGFGYNEADDLLHCREAYTSASAVLVHLGNVNVKIKELLAVSELVKFNVVGPRAECDKLAEPLGPFNPVFYYSD